LTMPISHGINVFGKQKLNHVQAWQERVTGLGACREWAVGAKPICLLSVKKTLKLREEIAPYVE